MKKKNPILKVEDYHIWLSTVATFNLDIYFWEREIRDFDVSG